jgi:arylsulfatase A-like enzyme
MQAKVPQDSDRTRITRRELLAAAGVTGVGLAASRFARAQPIAPELEDSRPNIVFILADDLGYADLSCYGRADLRTPNIDGIASGGLRLLQAYANSAVCTATRTALITGRYQYRLPLGLEEPLAGHRDIGLPPQHPTLASLLRKAGYGTTLVGKWHMGVLPKYGPEQSGYDHFYGFRGGALDYYSHKDPEHVEDLWNDSTPIRQEGYLTELFGDRAVQVIEEYAASKRRFLLSLHFNAPHWPWEAPGDAAESCRLAGTSLFDFDGGTQKTYVGMIEEMDRQVGRVLAALDAHGLVHNTIVIFTSDNGGERYADTWPFTGRKTELLEGGLRIPAVIGWPGHIAPGQTHDQVTISMDWLPTLLAAAGATADPAYPSDGMNLLPMLTSGAPPVMRTLYWRYKANRQRAVRDGDFKYLKILDNTFLFNVVEDPLERANLRERHKDVYKRLVAQWHAWNATMLPEIGASFTQAFTGAQLADHIGARDANGKPDRGDD